MRLLAKPQVGEGGVWQQSSRPQVARRECRNSRRRKISRTSRFKLRALAVAFVESPILLELGRRLLASTNSPRPLCLGEEFSLMLRGPYRVISETLVAEKRPPSPGRGRRGQNVRPEHEQRLLRQAVPSS